MAKIRPNVAERSSVLPGPVAPGSPTATDIADKMQVDQERLERFVRESPGNTRTSKGASGTRSRSDPGQAAVIIDGMGIPKSGEDSVGVARQWCGATGKVDNCQVTVNCTLARPGERQNADQLTWPLGMRLYLPKKWAGADDAEYEDQQQRERFAQRREDANIPDDIEHRTKLEIAAGLVEHVVSADIEHGCVVADQNYGKSRSFRQKLRGLDEPYIMDVSPSSFSFVSEETELLRPEDSPTGNIQPTLKQSHQRRQRSRRWNRRRRVDRDYVERRNSRADVR
ncbi:transposase [Natrialba swarupiae]|nr:transposase [Natrialba swarupiae]